MYRVLSIVLTLLLLIGAVIYYFYFQSLPKQAELPPTPQDQSVNTPVLTPQEIEYKDKMQQLEEKQENDRNNAIHDIEISNKAISSVSPEDCKEVVSEITRTMCEERTYEALALKNKDIAHCENIKDDAKKSVCTDKIYILQAKEKSDTVICDMISHADLRTQCVSQVEMKVYNKNQIDSTSSGAKSELNCKNYTNSGVIIQCLSDEQKKEDYELLGRVLQGGNTTLCKDIHDEKVQTDCYDGVYYTQAKNTLSVSECEKIMNTSIKTQCLSTISTINDAKYFQEAIQRQDILTCGNIVSERLRTDCSDRIRMNQIIQSKDITECSNLSEQSLQETCKNSIGIN